MSPATPVRFHLGAQTSEVVIHVSGMEPRSMSLALGTDALVNRCFTSSPPTPLSVERAIELVEEQVMPCHRWIPPGAWVLWTAAHGHRVMQWASSLAEGDTGQASLEQLEALFNRLVDRIQGRPAAQDPVPTDALFVATVLILREFLHHTQAAGVVLVPAATDPV